MCCGENLAIDLRTLAEGSVPFSCQLGNGYFKTFSWEGVSGGNVLCEAHAAKLKEGFEVSVSVKGTVTLICDRCLETMEQPVDNAETILVKYRSQAEEGDDAITVDDESGVLDMADLIREIIAVGIPIRHIHPDGQCNAEMLRRLEGLQKHGNGGAETAAADPRWSKLGGLKTDSGELQTE